MPKKEKRISINALERIAKEQAPGIITEQWYDIEVSIKPFLPLMEMLEFSMEIVDTCFLDDGDFMPEVMDFIVKSGVLTHYANFTLPDSISKQYWLVYNTDAVDMVMRHINVAQLQEIVDSANRKIAYICNSESATIRAKMDEFLESVGAMQEQTEDVFGGLSQEDVGALLSAVQSSGELSEEKIVEAYVDIMRRQASDALAPPTLVEVK